MYKNQPYFHQNNGKKRMEVKLHNERLAKRYRDYIKELWHFKFLHYNYY